ncbi:hypothetical protein GGR52DRAFT_17296 [Hypoxylon sp. FL1284]|nr:hypothetical protein GGR52DRAFT_17296 [Hypoxylon sp. FL1284]
MPSYHGRVACQAIPSRPVALLVASYGPDSQLRSTVISSDNKHRYSSSDAPDEGVFIMFQDRALQIAAPPCDKRKCKSICHCCDTPSYPAAKMRPSSPSSPSSRDDGAKRRRRMAWPMWKPCQSCLVNWLRLYPAAEAAHKLGMQFLQHPRSLTWAKANGRLSIRYDSELEEDETLQFTQNGSCRRTSCVPSCPPKLFKWMTDAWGEFIASGCYKPDRVVALSDSEDESCNELSSTAGVANGASSDDDWDDLDIPCRRLSQSCRSKSSGDYDLFDDVIEEEFPKLQKESAAKTAVRPQEKPEARKLQERNDSANEEEDTPVPVIVPPKNMSIGRLQPIPKPRVPSTACAGEGTIACATSVDLPRTNPKPSLGNKRSHNDFITPGPLELRPAEDYPRKAKYQRLESRRLSRYRHPSSAYQRELSRFGYSSPNLIVV